MNINPINQFKMTTPINQIKILRLSGDNTKKHIFPKREPTETKSRDRHSKERQESEFTTQRIGIVWLPRTFWVRVARIIISVRMGVTRTSTPEYPSSASSLVRTSLSSAKKTPSATNFNQKKKKISTNPEENHRFGTRSSTRRRMDWQAPFASCSSGSPCSLESRRDRAPAMNSRGCGFWETLSPRERMLAFYIAEKGEGNPTVESGWNESTVKVPRD